MARSYIDIGGAQAKLAAIGTQAPFALALALTTLAKDAAAVVTKLMPQVFDRPTPFTVNAAGILPASKDVPTAQVFVKDIQAGYLGLEETGGVRHPEPGAPIIVPVDITTNAYGNIPKGALARERAKRTTFVAKPGGRLRPGVYQRQGRRLRFLAAVERTATYRPRFQFVETVVETIKQRAPLRLREAMLKALATARR